MPRYRKSGDSLRDLAVDILALVLVVLCIFWIFGALSLPNAFKFSFSATPTPMPAPELPNSSMAGLEWIAVLAILGILIGGGGLIVLGIIWLLTRNAQQSRNTAPVPAASIVPDLPSPTPTSVLSTEDEPEIVTPAVVAPVPPTVTPTSEESKPSVEAKSVMSGFERSFFWALSKAVQNDYYIFPQIPLRELLFHTQGLAHDLRGMLSKGVVDFVLVNPNTLEAVLAFEFDDPSHRQADAQARDRRKEEFLQHVGIPLLRFHSGGKWNADALREQIRQSSLESCQPIPFLDDGECSLFRALREAREDLYIFPKVPLKRIIRREDWLPFDMFKALENESVDFLLAHPRYLGTLLVIELNDSDYSNKTDLLQQAGIRWICFSETAIPTAMQLRERIAQVTNQSG